MLSQFLADLGWSQVGYRVIINGSIILLEPTPLCLIASWPIHGACHIRVIYSYVLHFLGGCSRSLFDSPAELPPFLGKLILLSLWYLVYGRIMLCFKCWFVLPRRIFVGTPPLQININIKSPARKEVGGPSQIGIQSSSFAADAGFGLGIVCGLGPVDHPLPRVHVLVVVVFVNAGEEARSSSSSACAPPPLRSPSE